MMELAAVLKVMFGLTKLMIQTAVDKEDVGLETVKYLFGGVWDFTENEAEKLLSLGKKFKFREQLSALGLAQDEEEKAYQVIDKFLHKIDAEQLIKKLGSKDKLTDQLIDQFATVITEDTEIKDLLGDKLEGVRQIFSDWGNYIWKAVPEKDELIFNQIAEGQQEQKIDNDYIIELLNQIISKMNHSSTPKEGGNNLVENCREDYQNKWMENVFLNAYPRSDKRRWMNMSLRDIYKPTVVCVGDDKIVDMDSFILDCLTTKDAQRLALILGKPGIGKSTFITYLLNQNDQGEINRQISEIINNRTVLVYRFKDIKIDWSGDISICVGYIIKRLLGDDVRNKILILDGFDEVNAGGTRNQILNELDRKISRKQGKETFTLFVTCRENYISNEVALNCYKASLVPYHKKEILEFCETYYRKILQQADEEQKQESLTKKEKQIAYFNNLNEEDTEMNIWGIPLILYMVLATDIELEESMSKAKVYERLFALNGGLYDRAFMCNNKLINWEDEHPMTSRDSVKKALDKASQSLAFQMFEDGNGYVTKETFDTICSMVRGEELKTSEIEISSYFEMIKHTESGTKVQFIHKSIYEYFVAKYIFAAIESILADCDTEDRKKNFAKKYYECFNTGELTTEIGEFLTYRILEKYSSKNVQLKSLYVWLEDMLVYLTEYGFSYWAEQKNEKFLDLLRKEARCFQNFTFILVVLSKWKSSEYILQFKNTTNVARYIREVRDLERKDLRSFALGKANLFEANLVGANLEGANLRRANLVGANLRRANLVGANLRRANLVGANLEGANLEGANLLGTILEKVAQSDI